MSVQNPTLPTATALKGIDSTVADITTHLSFELSWLSNGMGRAYRLKKVRSNGATQFLPMVYLGTSKYNYFDASPDNDKEGQSIILVGDGTYPDFQRGFYGIIEYPVSFIFSANLDTIDSALLATELFTEHLMEDVRQALIRDLLGKPYTLTIDTETIDFDSVYSEFDINTDAGKTNKPLAPMTYFRFDTTVQIRESCPPAALDRCTAIQQNLTQDDIDNCIVPNYCSITPSNNTSTLFDGVNESVISPYNAAHELDRLDSFSMDCWIKRATVSGGGTIIAKYAVTGIKRGYYLQSFFSTGQIRFVFVSQELGGNWISILSVASVPVDTWTHVGITYTGSGLASGFLMYINGLSVAFTDVADQLTGTTVAPGNVLKFGVAENTAYFNGNLFNAHIWKSQVLTPTEMLTMATTPIPTTPVQAASLVASNRLGGGSLYGSTTRVYPDDSGIVTGYESVNMESGDVVIDTPP